MPETATCLIEIGTEELPPLALERLANSFAAGVERELADAGLAPAAVERFATPRRLAMLLRDTPLQQADRQIEKRGPALSAAFDADGRPTRAATGFAGSCGVAVDQLERRETDKGAWLYYRSTEPGRALAELLPAMAQRALQALPIPKRMRWGERSDEFVRPVKWCLFLLDDEIVECEIFGLAAGRTTRGHRFHAPGEISVARAADYPAVLREQGKVIADFDQRRDSIRAQVEAAAAEIGGRARIDAALLDEVTALVEYPVAVCGRFDRGFLELPPEVLVTTMQENQKYFALFDDDGGLLPHFITIANIDSLDPAQVAAGNERVIRPRFADAEFFFAQDRRQGLDAMRERLDSVVFQERLGSLGDKSRRLVRLARSIAVGIGADAELAARAAELAKADLMSDMVGEFPKLQGVMGRYYALHQREDPRVCDAIEQHYWPRHAGDRLPADGVGQAVALADRLDSLLGIFAIGARPAGDRDPFALRRGALAVLRILVENALDADLRELCRDAAAGFDAVVGADAVIDEVVAFVFDRQRAYYQEQGIEFDIVDAVSAVRPGGLADCDRRIRALHAFLEHPAAAALAAANKRIGNILKKQQILPGEVDAALFTEDAERRLFEQLQAVGAGAASRFAAGEYLEGLERLAALRPDVDRFFDQVMVMVDDAELRDNRLALLDQLMQSFHLVADFSRIQS